MSTELPTLDLTGMVVESPRRARFDRRASRMAWLTSLAIHGVAGVAIAIEIAVSLFFAIPQAVPATPMGAVYVLDSEMLTELPITLEISPSVVEIIEQQIAELAAADITPELAQQLLNPRDAGDDALAADWVLARVTRDIAAAEKLSQEEQFQKLEQLTGTLNAVGSEPGVEEATARLAQLLNTKPRATEPAQEPPPGEFDIDSAQLYDIKRTDNGRGGFDYAAVLLDAEGRTLESELTEAEGEQLFRTFELMKANPLLARVYRGVVMGLLDKLLRPANSPK